jgi:hypothetical protein
MMVLKISEKRVLEKRALTKKFDKIGIFDFNKIVKSKGRICF